jgi:hypothetical protein
MILFSQCEPMELFFSDRKQQTLGYFFIFKATQKSPDFRLSRIDNEWLTDQFPKRDGLTHRQ